MTTIPSLVSIIVLNWNSKDVIVPCLDSLLAQTYSHREIILIDNDSHDGSLQVIESRYSGKIQIYKNPKNLGFAFAVNQGIGHSKGEFIALLNSDAAAEPNWLEEMVKKCRQSPEVQLCASKIYLVGKNKVIENTGSSVSLEGLGRCRGRLEPDRGQYDQSPEALSPSGCAGFYRRSLLEKLGGFDSFYFAYSEDLDIGLRARWHGHPPAFVPSAIVHHDLSVPGGRVSPLKAYYVERNRLWILIKCFPAKYILKSPWHTFLRYFHIIRGMLKKQGPAAQYARQSFAGGLVWIVLKAYLATLWYLPHLLRERRKLFKNAVCRTADFDAWMKEYAISDERAALSEVA